MEDADPDPGGGKRQIWAGTWVNFQHIFDPTKARCAPGKRKIQKTKIFNEIDNELFNFI